MEDRTVEESSFGDGRAGALLGFWLALAAALTGAVWWNLAEGTPAHVHPGMLGVVVTPVAVLFLLYFAWRLVATRPAGR